VGTPGETVLLIVTNSPLWINEKGEFRTTDLDVMSFFLLPDRLAEATPEPGKYAVGFTPVSATRGGSVLGWLYVLWREERPPAEVKKVVALAEKLIEQALLQIYKTNMASLDEKVRRADAKVSRARLGVECDQYRLQFVRTQLIQLDASPEGIDQRQNTLRQDQLKLRVDLVGFKARREAIVKAVAEASDKLKAITDEQQRELSELSKIVDIREQQLSKLQRFLKQGAISISASEIQQAELEVARAKADLAERRRLIAQQAGSEQLSRLNQQLADVQIEMSAAEARVADIEAMLNRLQSKEVLGLLSQYGQATQQLEYARAEEKAAFEQLAEAKKTAESTPAPKVVEIRGPAAPK
jgi:chromosome segregation ATPase